MIQPLVSVPGAMSYYIDPQIAPGQLIYDPENHLIASQGYFRNGLLELLKECAWIFLIGKKTQIPQFLYDTIINDDFDQDGSLPDFSSGQKLFIDFLIRNDILEVVSTEIEEDSNFQKSIFERTHQDFKELIHEEIGSENISRYHSLADMSLQENILHRNFTQLTKKPIILIDRFESHMRSITKEDLIPNKSEIFKEVLSLYAPRVSLIEPAGEIGFFPKEDKKMDILKEKIEIIHLMRSSPLSEVFSHLYMGSFNDLVMEVSEKDQLKIFKDYLKRSDHLSDLKKMSFSINRISEVSGLFLPSIGALNYVNKIIENKLTKDYHNKHGEEAKKLWPSLFNLFYELKKGNK